MDGVVPFFKVRTSDGKIYSLPDEPGSVTWAARAIRLGEGRLALAFVHETASHAIPGFSIYLEANDSSELRVPLGILLPETIRSDMPAPLFTVLGSDYTDFTFFTVRLAANGGDFESPIGWRAPKIRRCGSSRRRLCSMRNRSGVQSALIIRSMSAYRRRPAANHCVKQKTFP